MPTGDVPFYKPLVVPPNDLKEPDGVQPEASEDVETGIRNVNIPVLDFKVPLPENEILITASTTAVVSVAATLTATAAFKGSNRYETNIKNSMEQTKPKEKRILLAK